MGPRVAPMEEIPMAINGIQMQAGLSLPEFAAAYGTEAKS